MGLHEEAKLDRKFAEMAKLMNVYLNHPGACVKNAQPETHDQSHKGASA